MLVSVNWTDENGDDKDYSYRIASGCPPFVGSKLRVWVPVRHPDGTPYATRSAVYIEGVVESVDFDMITQFSGAGDGVYQRYEAVIALRDVVTHCEIDDYEVKRLS